MAFLQKARKTLRSMGRNKAPPPMTAYYEPVSKAGNMDINEDSVRSFSQLLKRAESDPGTSELRSSVSNGKSSSAEDNPEDMDFDIPKILRRDSIVSRTSRRSAQEPAKRKFKDIVLKVSVGLLFLVIVCGLVVIYHFHHLELHMLQLSKKIQLNEDNRVLTIERNATFKALIGRLGMHLPDYEWPFDCSDYSSEGYKTHKCLRWENRAQVDIYYESRNVNDTMAECHSIHWQDLSDLAHKDCYLLDEASWIGGGLLWENFPSPDSNADPVYFVTNVSPEDRGAGQVLEPFWISSRGVSIFVDGQIPLRVSVKKLTFERSKLRKFKHIEPPPKGRYMCLAPYVSPELKLKFENATQWLNYTVCVGSNMKTVQQYAMKYKVPKLRPLKDKSIFVEPLFSTVNISADFTQRNITDFAKALHNAGQKGTLMIKPGWEKNPGDFTFDPMRFPNVTEMMEALHGYQLKVNLPVHPYIGVHSSHFGSYSDLGLFIMDGTGRSPGLTRWKCYNCEEAIVAVIDLSITDATQDLQYRIKQLTDTVQPNYLSFYGGDASSLPYMAYQSGPQVNMYTEQFSSFAANTTDTVFLQSAFSAQDINPFLMMPCDDSSWSSLTVLLKRVMTVGLTGYPNVVQGPIGGCNADSISEELYIRWLQLGSFLPVLHFSGVPGSMSSRASEVATNMLRIRNQKVIPVIMKLLNNTQQNSPLVRPLWWFEPKSWQAIKADNQFMIGDDILVVPVLTQGATSMKIYLPRGYWRNGWNESSIHIGPQVLKLFTVELDKIPFFIYKRK